MPKKHRWSLQRPYKKVIVPHPWAWTDTLRPIKSISKDTIIEESLAATVFAARVFSTHDALEKAKDKGR